MSFFQAAKVQTPSNPYYDPEAVAARNLVAKQSAINATQGGRASTIQGGAQVEADQYGQALQKSKAARAALGLMDQ